MGSNPTLATLELVMNWDKMQDGIWLFIFSFLTIFMSFALFVSLTNDQQELLLGVTLNAGMLLFFGIDFYRKYRKVDNA